MDGGLGRTAYVQNFALEAPQFNGVGMWRQLGATMSLHRARLKSRDYIAEDGTIIPMIRDEVPLGTEYVVDASRRFAPQKMYNTRLQRCFWVKMIYVRRVDKSDSGWGLLPAAVFDIDDWEMP